MDDLEERARRAAEAVGDLSGEQDRDWQANRRILAGVLFEFGKSIVSEAREEASRAWLSANEVRFEGPVDMTTGWSCAMAAMEMERAFREQFEGRLVDRASLRLSVWVETDAEMGARLIRESDAE